MQNRDIKKQNINLYKYKIQIPIQKYQYSKTFLQNIIMFII